MISVREFFSHPGSRAIPVSGNAVAGRRFCISGISGETGSPSMPVLLIFLQFRAQNRYAFLLELLWFTKGLVLPWNGSALLKTACPSADMPRRPLTG
ncbi:hypothetical protein [Agrobacterium tumefaciens]|jgi:hypothetical protein|uniref:hypothetical protein n=1 Tax=Agrobacterium tumefaciens TaxID=358 RepID=UPI001644F25B|nr:hypothetical protein [Agrobacterium tumefaciens]